MVGFQVSTSIGTGDVGVASNAIGVIGDKPSFARLQKLPIFFWISIGLLTASPPLPLLFLQMRRLFARALQNGVVMAAMHRQRTAEDWKKLHEADEDRRNLYAPWMRRHSNERAHHFFSQQLSALLAYRPLGSRYRDDLVEVRPVRADDGMPASVVGELGVVAKVPIPQDTLIGIYEGRILNWLDLYTNKENADYFMDASPPSLSSSSADEEDRLVEGDFTIDPTFPYGNGVMERINDYRLDVSQTDLDPLEDEAVNPFARCNVHALQMLSEKGEPWTCIVSSAAIDIDKPLLLDYGPLYWRAKLRRMKKNHNPDIF